MILLLFSWLEKVNCKFRFFIYFNNEYNRIFLLLKESIFSFTDIQMVFRQIWTLVMAWYSLPVAIAQDTMVYGDCSFFLSIFKNVLLTLINCLWPISNDARRSAICVSVTHSFFNTLLHVSIEIINCILCSNNSNTVYLVASNLVLLKEILRIMPTDNNNNNNDILCCWCNRKTVPWCADKLTTYTLSLHRPHTHTHI